jgi:tRNA A37 threonylcarbamoyladenosine synthetase subunit TsaC/SUA5/YrdC
MTLHASTQEAIRYAASPRAVANIFTAKGRPADHPPH